MDVFEMIAEERRGLADLAETLTEEQLRTPSLVPTWAVRDVLGHLVLALDFNLAQLFLAVLKARGFERAFDRLAWDYGKRPVGELVTLLRERAGKRFTPPGEGPEAPLAEQLIHGLDIRWPLAIERKIPENRALMTLDFLGKTPARHFSRRSWRQGLRFEATDLSWTHGDGPLLRGHSEALMLAMTGRRAALAKLEGDGVPLLAQRFGPAGQG